MDDGQGALRGSGVGDSAVGADAGAEQLGAGDGAGRAPTNVQVRAAVYEADWLSRRVPDVSQDANEIRRLVNQMSETVERQEREIAEWMQAHDEQGRTLGRAIVAHANRVEQLTQLLADTIVYIDQLIDYLPDVNCDPTLVELRRRLGEETGGGHQSRRTRSAWVEG